MDLNQFAAMFRDAAAYIAERSVDGVECELKLFPDGFAVDARAERNGSHYAARSLTPFHEVFAVGSFRPVIDRAIAENERYIAIRCTKELASDHAPSLNHGHRALTRTAGGLIPIRMDNTN